MSGDDEENSGGLSKSDNTGDCGYDGVVDGRIGLLGSSDGCDSGDCNSGFSGCDCNSGDSGATLLPIQKTEDDCCSLLFFFLDALLPQSAAFLFLLFCGGFHSSRSNTSPS